MDSCIEFSGSIHGQELRDSYFGLVFGIMAVIRSGRLCEDKSVLDKLLGQLVELGPKKVYLSDICSELLVSLVQSLPAKRLLKHLLPKIMPLLVREPAGADTIALTLALEARGSEINDISEPNIWQSRWRKGRVLHHSNFNAIIAALCDNGNSLPTLHCAWRLVFTQLVVSKASLIQDFWNRVFDEGLFSPARATHDRKALGFKLFLTFFPLLAHDKVCYLLFSVYLV